MLTVAEAVEQLIQSAQPIVEERHRSAVQRVPLLQSLGRVLSSDITAAVDVPPAANSAMDGYAFCVAEAEANNWLLPVSQRIPAGSAPSSLAAGTAARIFTGGEIPRGADTVAMQEVCTEQSGAVRIEGRFSAGDNLRPQGQDIQAGQVILSAGHRLRPQEMGLLASVGIDSVAVYKPLKVGIFSTGNELVDPGTPLQPGQIYNSNRATLTGLIQSLGMEVVDLGSVPDRPEATEHILKKAAAQADIVLSAGGVSVGEEDHIKGAVEKIGRIEFWKLAIKPGKPLAFGSLLGKPFIGLPGNPASVFVTFMILARPFLLACQGSRHSAQLFVKAQAKFSKPGETRELYLRGRLSAEGVEIHPNQSSGVLSSACWGEVFVRQVSGVSIQQGDWVDVLPYQP